jgi:hypothetical protein
LIDSTRDSFSRGTLYVVATPIGNLADISARAIAAFQVADVVCAEDTRVTGQLLSAYGVTAKLVSVREHNERGMAEQVIRWLADDKIVVQVSDAGTPAVSDPGARLAEAVSKRGLCGPEGHRIRRRALLASVSSIKRNPGKSYERLRQSSAALFVAASRRHTVQGSFATRLENQLCVEPARARNARAQPAALCCAARRP